jgi:predicted amidohydrolase
VRIAACQPPEVLGDVDGAVRVVRDFAARADADLLLFPECFLQGYLVDERHLDGHAYDVTSPEFAAVLAELADIGPTVVLGIIERSGGTYHNTAVVVARGRVVGRYRKTFLTAGEALFTPGDGYPVFDHAGVRFGINICYDTQFAGAATAVAGAGARVLLVPAQNMMGRAKALSWQHRHNAIRALRARETGLWVVSADVTGERGDGRVGLGPTSVISPTGEVVSQVPTGTTGMVVLDL